MKHLFTGLFLILSILALTVAWALNSSNPVPPPLKLLPGTSQTQSQDNPQIEDIHDIKGPVPLTDSSHFAIPAVTILVVFIIAGLIFLFLKRRKKPRAPLLLPDVIALSELNSAKILMTQENSLIYAERISNILRQYIESRFQIRSTRQTTREFFDRLHDGTTIAEVDIKNHAGDLQDCMEQCDMAKFARGIPNNDDMLQMDKAARTFIETTRQNRDQAPSETNQPLKKGRP